MQKQQYNKSYSPFAEDFNELRMTFKAILYEKNHQPNSGQHCIFLIVTDGEWASKSASFSSVYD